MSINTFIHPQKRKLINVFVVDPHMLQSLFYADEIVANRAQISDLMSIFLISNFISIGP